MPRIRTIKPEFWTDDLVGALTRDQRLLFIASWNIADDEGLLRWSAPFLKGAVFAFDDDISVSDVDVMMTALVKVGIIFPYLGGRSQQRLAYIINFHKHQKINRPSPSKLPPPPIQSQTTREMYAARDGYVCHLCEGAIDERYSQGSEFVASVDHLKPVSSGGSDYPSNIRAAHETCNKGRGNRSADEYRELVRSGNTVAQRRFPERFEHLTEPSLSNSVNPSPQEGEGETEHGVSAEAGASGESGQPKRSDLIPTSATITPIYTDSRHELWGEGVAILTQLGVAEKSVRPIIGRWLRDTNDNVQAVLGAIQRARDARVVDAIPWITQALGNGNEKSRQGSNGGRAGTGFSAVALQRARAAGIDG